MTCIAVVLARAGSKGLPGKNTRVLGGRPCVQWSIDDAADAQGVDAVLVSSDDPMVLRLARDAGAEPIPRPAELASDAARVDDALRHAVDAYESSAPGRKVHTVVLLYGNVPVRPAGLIDRAIAAFHEGAFDSLQSYCPVGKYHPWWMSRVDPVTGVVSPWEGDVLNHGVHRRQDLPPAFVPDGGALVVRRSQLLSRSAAPHAFLGKRTGAVLTNPGEVIDIDCEIDSIVADNILSQTAKAA